MRILREKDYPSNNAIGKIDACIHDVKGTKPQYEEWKRQYCKNHRDRLAHDLQLVEERFEASQVIVDVGSAPYVLSLALARRGHSVKCVDVEPARFKIKNATGIESLRVDIENEQIPINDEACDIVILNEVFEHLRINPIFTMRELHRILKPNGTMFLSTPNLRSISGIWNFIVHRESYSCARGIYSQYERLNHIGHMGHVREYTTRELTDFVKQIGFKPEEIVYRGFRRLPKSWMRGIASLKINLAPFQTLIMCKQ